MYLSRIFRPTPFPTSLPFLYFIIFINKMSIPLKQGRRFCFTLWDDFCFKQNIFSTEVKYCVIGAEKSSSTLRDHYQGFISFTNVKRPGAVKDFLGSQTVHLTNATGSDLQNKVYCSKEGYVIFELGEPVAPGQHKRKRIQLCEEDPESAKIEYPDMYNRYICLQKRYADVHPRHPWQNILMEYISGSPDHRSIYWIYGPDGGEVKTEFSKLLEAKYNYFVVKPTKFESMMYYYVDDNTTKHACVDIPRRVQQSL
ncbi:hypothetical protein CsSME_00041810 [Camellia sinensis var. sinensis]